MFQSDFTPFSINNCSQHTQQVGYACWRSALALKCGSTPLVDKPLDLYVAHLHTGIDSFNMLNCLSLFLYHISINNFSQHQQNAIYACCSSELAMKCGYKTLVDKPLILSAVHLHIQVDYFNILNWFSQLIPYVNNFSQNTHKLCQPAKSLNSPWNTLLCL